MDFQVHKYPPGIEACREGLRYIGRGVKGSGNRIVQEGWMAKGMGGALRALADTVCSRPIPAVFFTLTLCASAWAGPKKVLVLGIDGCRPDALRQAKAPNLKRLIDSGYVTWTARTATTTLSGPGWTSMITGVQEGKHAVHDNAFAANRIAQYPPFFKRIEEKQPALSVRLVAHWAPIKTYLSAGADTAETFATDSAVASRAADILRNGNPDALFLHFDDVDHAGHACCFDPGHAGYLKAIETVDAHIGRVLAALRGRPAYAQEDWLVLGSTDHGGEGSSHGGTTAAHYTIFIIASGPSSQRGISTAPAFVGDVAATALAHLLGASEIPAAWGLDGKPFGLKATPSALLPPRPSFGLGTQMKHFRADGRFAGRKGFRHE